MGKVDKIVSKLTKITRELDGYNSKVSKQISEEEDNIFNSKNKISEYSNEKERANRIASKISDLIS